MEGLGLAGWTFSERAMRDALKGDILLNPSIDLGNPCNLNCPYCFIEEKSSTRKVRRPNELTLEETLSVLKDFADLGAQSVNIVGAGEPTIDQHFEEIVACIAASGARPIVFTNGIRLAKESRLVNFLARMRATVVVKYNAFSTDVQDAVVGQRGYSKIRDSALTRLMDAGFNSTHPTHLGVDTLAFYGNLTELPSIHRWCRMENIYPLTAEYIPTGRTADGTIDDVASMSELDSELSLLAKEALRPLANQEREWLRARIEEVDTEFGLWHFGEKAYFGGGMCTQLLGVYVDIQGMIWPCVARTKIGSSSKSPLGSIRRGDRASEIWRHSRYLQWIRKSYSGACPYKPSLAPTGRILSERTGIEDKSQLHQIGVRLAV